MKLRDMALVSALLVGGGGCGQPSQEGACERVAGMVKGKGDLIIGKVDGIIGVARHEYMNGDIVPSAGTLSPGDTQRVEKIMHEGEVCKIDGLGNGHPIASRKLTQSEIAAAVIATMGNTSN